MTISVLGADDAAHEVVGLAIIDAGGMSQEVARIVVRDTNNVSQTVFSLVAPLSAVAIPSTVFGSSVGSGTATTSTTTATPTGGVAPYTYSWALDTLDGPTPPFANSPASAGTTFTQTSMLPGDSYSATWICTVTDSDGTTAQASASSYWSN